MPFDRLVGSPRDFLLNKYKQMKIEDYWWEKLVLGELSTCIEDEYRSTAEMILLVKKIIDEEIKRNNKK